MPKPTTDTTYEQIKQCAKETYSKIGKVWCPALNDYVIFDNSGFKHLIRKGGKLRRRSDQIRRLKLVPYLKAIIENTSIWTDHRKIKTEHPTYHQGLPQTIKSEANFWSLEGKNEKEIIKIIIRGFKKGKKHFFSVFPDEKTPQ